jgi:hypothetical protein
MWNDSTRKLNRPRPKRLCAYSHSGSEENMDQAAILDHQFRVAAYVITWVLQLGYLAWLGAKWRAQKREADRTRRPFR